MTEEYEYQNEQWRAQAAELILSARPALESRIHQLLGRNARRITDTQEILSTVLRRVDRVICKGEFRQNHTQAFYKFVHTVLERAVLEKARASGRLNAREVASIIDEVMQETGLVTRHHLSEAADQINSVLSDSIDREIVHLRGRGLTHAEIARSLELEPAAVRQRWLRIRSKARRMLGQGDNL